MSSTPFPKLYSLREAMKVIDCRHVTSKILRAEVHAGRLRCVRARPGNNAKILIEEDELHRWFDEHARRRQRAPRDYPQQELNREDL